MTTPLHPPRPAPPRPETLGSHPEHDDAALPEVDVIAFCRARSVPCPRCAYDLRDIQSPTCPECGESLVLKVGSAKPRFGWLLLAVAPGCFSGVASLFVAVPIVAQFWFQVPAKDRMPWPGYVAEAFGVLSAASVVVMYRRRHRIMAWTSGRQAAFAGGVWGVHVLMFVLVLTAMALVT